MPVTAFATTSARVMVCGLLLCREGWRVVILRNTQIVAPQQLPCPTDAKRSCQPPTHPARSGSMGGPCC